MTVQVDEMEGDDQHGRKYPGQPNTGEHENLLSTRSSVQTPTLCEAVCDNVHVVCQNVCLLEGWCRSLSLGAHSAASNGVCKISSPRVSGSETGEEEQVSKRTGHSMYMCGHSLDTDGTVELMSESKSRLSIASLACLHKAVAQSTALTSSLSSAVGTSASTSWGISSSADMV